MMRRFLTASVRDFVPWLAVLALLFYVVPIPMRFVRFLALILINPVVLFLVYFFCGRRPSPNLLCPLWSGVLFLPSVFMYYGFTALGWTIGYIAISYIALGIGYASRSRSPRQK